MFTAIRNSRRKHKGLKAQTFVEYTMLIGALVTMFIAATPLVKRGVNAMLKLAADHIGNQEAADQLGGDFGMLAYSNSDTDVRKETRNTQIGAAVRKRFNTNRIISINSFVNQGFSEKKTRDQ